MSDRITIEPRGMPRSDEAEKGILSCFLQNPVPLLNDAAAKLPEEAFYHVGNRLLYVELQALNSKGAAIDVVTLSRHLFDRQLMDKVGGAALITELDRYVSTPANYAEYRRDLLDKLLARRVIGLCHETVASIHDAPDAPKEALAALAGSVIALEQSGIPTYRTMPQLVQAALDRYQEAMKLDGKLPGIPTGHNGLDEITGGWRKGRLVVIGGGTSDGKSAFVDGLVVSAARRGHPSAIYTFEMSDDEIVDRFFCIQSGVSSDCFNLGKFNHEESRAVTRAAGELTKLPLYIRDVSGMKLGAMLADMRMLKRQYGVEIFAVDYGQLVRPDSKGHTRESEVAEMSGKLKAAAKTLGATIIVLSQLNDDGKLRESRAIGMDADQVFTLSLPPTEPGEEPDESRRVLFVGKNRAGRRRNKLNFRYDGPTFTFTEDPSTEPTNEPRARQPYKS